MRAYQLARVALFVVAAFDGATSTARATKALDGSTVRRLVSWHRDLGFAVTVGRDAYFTTRGRIWRTRGDPSQTRPVPRIRLHQSKSFANLYSVAGHLVVQGRLEAGRDALWAVDAGGRSQRLADGLVRTLGTVGDVLVFATGSFPACQLWKTDGTPPGTSPLAVTECPSYIIPARDRFFFVMLDGDQTSEIVMGADLTGPATRLTRLGLPADIHPGGDGAILLENDPSGGVRVWNSDGTSTGTVRVTHISGMLPSGFNGDTDVAIVGRAVYFTLESPAGLWRTDGTVAGTWLVRGDPDLAFDLYRPAAVGDVVYFTAGGLGGLDAALFLTQDAPESTQRVASLGGIGFPYNFTAFDGPIYFVVDSYSGPKGFETSIWRTDGTPAGTVMVADRRSIPGGMEAATLFSTPDTLYIVTYRKAPYAPRACSSPYPPHRAYSCVEGRVWVVYPNASPPCCARSPSASASS